jgi:hypothetical protein
MFPVTMTSPTTQSPPWNQPPQNQTDGPPDRPFQFLERAPPSLRWTGVLSHIEPPQFERDHQRMSPLGVGKVPETLGFRRETVNTTVI